MNAKKTSWKTVFWINLFASLFAIRVVAETGTISSVNISDVRPTSALLQWQTSMPTHAVIFLGLASNHYDATFRATIPLGFLDTYDLQYDRQDHATALVGLLPNHIYYARIQSLDANLHSTLSEEITFTTARTKAGDFNGDGIADIALSSEAIWAFELSQSSAPFPGRAFIGSQMIGYGVCDLDIPLVADYDGDGKADIAVYRPSTGRWYFRYSSGKSDSSVVFGMPNVDVPIVGDFDGDGKADVAVYRSASAQWFFLYSGAKSASVQTFGRPGDIPVVGDYDGDGIADIAVYRPPTGEWFFRLSSGRAMPKVQFGGPQYQPIVGDFDGDGKADIAVYRSDTSQWYFRYSSGKPDGLIAFGAPRSSGTPVIGDFDGDGIDDFGLYEPLNKNLYFHSLSTGVAPFPFHSNPMIIQAEGQVFAMGVPQPRLLRDYLTELNPDYWIRFTSADNQRLYNFYKNDGYPHYCTQMSGGGGSSEFKDTSLFHGNTNVVVPMPPEGSLAIAPDNIPAQDPRGVPAGLVAP